MNFKKILRGLLLYFIYLFIYCPRVNLWQPPYTSPRFSAPFGSPILTNSSSHHHLFFQLSSSALPSSSSPLYYSQLFLLFFFRETISLPPSLLEHPQHLHLLKHHHLHLVSFLTEDHAAPQPVTVAAVDLLLRGKLPSSQENRTRWLQ